MAFLARQINHWSGRPALIENGGKDMNTNSRNGNIDYENRGRLDLTEFSKKAEPLGILGLVVTQHGEEGKASVG